MSSVSRQLKNPPLLEVYCEFIFDSPEDEQWDGLRISDFIGKIGNGYTQHRMMHQGGGQARLHDEVEDDREGIGDPTEPVPLFRFSTEDGGTTVQVGENLLVVNQLPPYYGWSRFAPGVLDAIEAYRTTWKSGSIARAFLHYVDYVFIPVKTFEFREYFNVYPVLPTSFDKPSTNLSLSFDIEGCGEGDVLSVAIQQEASPDPDGMSFRLNWDYGSTQPIELGLGLSKIHGWLDAAHACCRYHFDSMFTERGFALFEPEVS